MRNAFSNASVATTQKNSKVLLLTGDHGYTLFDAFRKACPAQYLDCGGVEQSMVGVAAGLAKTGFRPIVYSLAALVSICVLEQIKIDACYGGLPVTFIGAGVVYDPSKHRGHRSIAGHATNSIHSPCDRSELTVCIEYIMCHSVLSRTSRIYLN